MDTQNYIESGVLELYVMDALPREEMAEVERRAASDPAIAREIRAIRETLAMLDEHHRRAPRREMRATILDAIEAEETSAQFIAHVGDRSTAAARVIPLEPSTSVPSRYLLAASWILVALSVGSAAFFGVQWREAVAEAEALRDENRSLASQNSMIASRAMRAEEALSIMRSVDYHAVQLNGTEHAPHAHPVVYWNPASREVHVVAKNLPAPPEGKQYQLWAIHDGHRIDAGVFSVDGRADSIQRLKDIEAAEGFAVTLERAGGSPVPDLKSVFAMGRL